MDYLELKNLSNISLLKVIIYNVRQFPVKTVSKFKKVLMAINILAKRFMLEGVKAIFSFYGI